MAATKQRLRTLYPHQRTELRTLLRQDLIALFWRMRLGKTLAAIRWAEHRREGPVFVVAPLSVLSTWRDELLLEGLASYQVSGPVVSRAEVAQAQLDKGLNWILCNYEGLSYRHDKRTYPSPLAQMDWDTVILDESACIRSPKAMRSKVAVRHLSAAPRKALLSGMPNPENPILDYVMQYQFLFGSFLEFKNFWRYRQSRFDATGFDWIPKRGTIAEAKRLIQRTSSQLTRKQAGFFTPKVYEKRMVELPSAIRKLYDAVERNYELGEEETKYAVVARTWLHRIVGGFAELEQYHHSAKIDEVVSLLTGELVDEPVLIFFRFNRELHAVALRLRNLGLNVLTITGQTRVADRHLRRQKFQEGKCRIMLLQTRVVQYGLDFSHAQSTIYYSNYDEYDLRAQSEDRTITVASEEPRLYIDIVVRDTVDEDIWDAGRMKASDNAAFRSNIVESTRRRALRNATFGD